MELTWGQLAITEFMIKNPQAHKLMVAERRWLLGKHSTAFISEAIQTTFQRHDALWTSINIAGSPVRKLSQFTMTQELSSFREVEITQAESYDIEAVAAWRLAELPAWRSPGGSLWEGGSIEYKPRALVIKHEDGQVEAIIRIGHASIDAASFADLREEVRDYIAMEETGIPVSLEERLQYEKSRPMLRAANRSKHYLDQAIQSAGAAYLLCEDASLEYPVYQTVQGLVYQKTREVADRMGVSTAQLWLAILLNAVGRTLKDNRAICKTQTTIRANCDRRRFVAPVTRAAVVRTDLDKSDFSQESVNAITSATMSAFKYSRYNPRDLWVAEEKRAAAFHGTLRGQILFNIRTISEWEPRIQVGEVKTVRNCTLSFDQRILFNIDMYPSSGTVSASITCRDVPGISIAQEIFDDVHRFFTDRKAS